MSYVVVGSAGTLSIAPRSVDGWDYAQTAQRVAILSSGSSSRDEVLQQGSEPPLQAAFQGQFFEYSDVLVMREYYRTKEVVVVTDPIEGEDHSCYVFEFTVKRAWPQIWEWAATFVETGSGSGS